MGEELGVPEVFAVVPDVFLELEVDVWVVAILVVQFEEVKVDLFFVGGEQFDGDFTVDEFHDVDEDVEEEGGGDHCSDCRLAEDLFEEGVVLIFDDEENDGKPVCEVEAENGSSEVVDGSEGGEESSRFFWDGLKDGGVGRAIVEYDSQGDDGFCEIEKEIVDSCVERYDEGCGWV